MATIYEVGGSSGLSPNGSYSGSYTWTLGSATINEIRVSGKCENNKTIYFAKGNRYLLKNSSTISGSTVTDTVYQTFNSTTQTLATWGSDFSISKNDTIGAFIDLSSSGTNTLALWMNIEYTLTGGGGGTVTYPFTCSAGNFYCSPSSVDPGNPVTFSWTSPTVVYGTLNGYKLYAASEWTNLLTANSINFNTDDTIAGETITAYLYYVGTGTNGTQTTVDSGLSRSFTVKNIAPQHITSAGNISGLDRSSGLFSSSSNYYINSSDTGSATLSWSASSGNNSYATRYYVIQKNNSDISGTTTTDLSGDITAAQLPAAGEVATYRVRCYSYASSTGATSTNYYTSSITVYGVGISSNTLNISTNNTFTNTALVSCNIPTIIINNAGASNISSVYTTQYRLKDSSTYTNFSPSATSTSSSTKTFTFDPTGIISLNQTVKFKITCTLYINSSISMDISAVGEASNYSTYGQEPNQLISLQYYLSNSDCYGTAPNDTYLVSSETWTLSNFRFGANNKIYLKVILGDIINSDTYNRCFDIIWKRGNDITGTITCILDETWAASQTPIVNYIELILSKSSGTTNTQVTYSGTAIECQCTNLFDTTLTAPVTFLALAKSQLISDTTTFLSNNSYALNTSTHFVLAKIPILWSEGTIPLQNITSILNVNFSTGEEPVTDYQLNNIQATSLSGVELYGYKVYINLGESDIEVTEPILSQVDTGATFDSTNHIFIPTSFVSPNDTTGNLVSLNLNVLSDPQYLYEALDISTLTTLDRIVNITYKITVVDTLKQESSTNSNVQLNAKYDFRIPSEMISSPIINFSDYVVNSSYTPLIRNIIYTGSTFVENALCFHGQSSNNSNAIKDSIIFEWYPAFKATDKASNPTHYGLIGDKYYLLEGFTDPNIYYIFKWNFGSSGLITNTYRNLKLSIENNDYYSTVESKTYINSNGETVTGNVIKYIGRYSINLRNIEEDELCYLCLVPAYSTAGENDKISYTTFSSTNAQLNHLCYNSSTTAVPIYIARFMNSTTLITGIDRTTDNNKYISFKINDYGTSKKLNSITINQSNFSGYGPLSRMLIEFVLLYQGVAVEYTSGQSIQTKDSNIDSTILDSFKYESNFDLDIYTNLLDKNAYTAQLSTSIYCQRSICTINNNVFIITGTEDSLTNIITQYVAPTFGTLSLRKNKIGINKSALTNKEETLSIVAKDRCDVSGATSYPNIIGIYNNDFSKMPNYDGTNTVPEITSSSNRGGYIGFYDSEDGVDTWKGSLGFEQDGNGYIVTSKIESGNIIYKKTKIGGVPIGTVMMWMTSTAPNDWLFADDGATYNIEDYPELAALWGTSFGGNGTTTFGVPNMKGRSPIALDPNNSVLDTIGKTAGNLTCTIQTANLPSHSHSMAHSHAIDHDHASTTSGNESAGHTHSISITSGNESANHTHTINHDHASFNTEYTGSHTHVASTGSYKVGGGSSSSYYYKTDDGSTNPTSTGSAGSHYHTIDVPSYSGNSGNTSASHTHSVNGTSGATSASHTHVVDLPSYTGTSGSSSAADTGTAGTGTAIDILHPVFVVRYIVKAL